MKKRGISLIVLIITIIVVIILAAVVILTLSKNNPIESAKEARFKEDVRTFQDELALAVSKEYANAGGHRDEKITTSDFEKIKEYIPSFSEKFKDKFIIEEDELKYTNVAEQEKEWCDSLYIKNGLPYTKLEYIESTGEQYIDTEYYANGNSSYLFEYSDNIINGVMFGAYNTGWSSGNGYYININSTDYGNPFLHYFSNTRIPIQYKKSAVVKINKGNLYINDEQYLNLSSKSFKLNYPIYVFCGNWSGIRLEQPTKFKLHYFKIYKDDEIIRDYIPVLDQNNKPALYDKVEGKFYYNQGTGEDFKYKLKE